MQEEEHLNYSKLLSNLITKDNTLDDVMVSFLYQLFPRDLFVRAFSLLESTNMLIYVWDNKENDHSATSNNESVSRCDSNTKDDIHSSTMPLQRQLGVETNKLMDKFYCIGSELIFRLVIRQEDELASPIYVDLEKWFCSCDEYTGLVQEILNSGNNLQDQLIKQCHNKHDLFARLNTQSGYMHARHEQNMCPHLLAFAILLQTNKNIFRYFVSEPDSRVYTFMVSSIDEWLKLHLNFV